MVAVRLQRLARDKDAVMVVREGERHGNSHTALAALRLLVEPAADGFVAAAPGSGAAWAGPRTVRVHIEKGGAPRVAVVTVGLALPHRLRPHWAVRDRRARSSGGRRSLGGRTQRPRCASPDWPKPR
jgi:hypothetical protein